MKCVMLTFHINLCLLGLLDHTNKLIQHEVCDVYIPHKFVFATY